MRVLLDECVSEGLRHYLAEHECQTAQYAGFAGLENGQLLTAAEAAKFEVRWLWIADLNTNKTSDIGRLRSLFSVVSPSSWKTSFPSCPLVSLTLNHK
jgi:hypothetical protein